MAIIIIIPFKVVDLYQEIAKPVDSQNSIFFIRKTILYQWYITVGPLNLPVMHLMKTDPLATTYNI